MAIIIRTSGNEFLYLVLSQLKYGFMLFEKHAQPRCHKFQSCHCFVKEATSRTTHLEKKIGHFSVVLRNPPKPSSIVTILNQFGFIISSLVINLRFPLWNKQLKSNTLLHLTRLDKISQQIKAYLLKKGVQLEEKFLMTTDSSFLASGKSIYYHHHHYYNRGC